MNVTYASNGDGNSQLPEGTQNMIASYIVTGVADFAKKMEDEGIYCDAGLVGSFCRLLFDLWVCLVFD